MSLQRRPLHVLVLDDDEKILRLLKIFMRQLGYRVSTARDGREGIRKVLRNHFDLIIVDVQMPVVDGLTFAREVLYLWPWENIILCTGFLNAEVKARAKELGIGAILEKPISFNTLEACIQQVVVPDDSEQDAASVPTWEEREDYGSELSFLRDYTDQVMEHQTFGQAIADFSPVIMKTVPAVAAGVMGLSGEYGRFSITSDQPLDPDLVASISRKIRDHLEFFSGNAMPCIPSPELNILHRSRPALTKDGHQVLMAPVAGGRDAMGMIFLVVPAQETHPPAQTSALRLCAHHLSTVVECLEHVRPERIHDPLTGVYTWSYAELQIHQAWHNSALPHQDLGWIDIDLRDFTSINDTFGFNTGDRILQEVAAGITRHLHKGELCARRGPDEFCVLLHHDAAGRVPKLAQQILGEVAGLRPMAEKGGDPVSCSIGTATTLGDPGISSGSQLIECAEHARFAADRSEDTRIISWSALKSSGQASISLHPVLVVDDDPQVISLIKRILPHDLYEVTGTESVAEAMALLEKGQRFEVMLTDLSLPHQDGIEMIRLGRSVDPEMIPVVVSGNISKDSEGKLQEKGAYEIIRKPFQPKYLKQVVQNASELYTRSLRKSQLS